jgi:hypothetical protein
MTKNTPLQKDTPQKKMANGRYEGTNYRYSDKFIKRVTGWLIASIFIGPAIGFGLGALGDVIFNNGYGADVPGWYTTIAISFALGGVILPLVVASWMGAMALNKYAGPVGLLLDLGIGAYVFGRVTEGQTMWLWIGIGVLVLSVLLFVYIGFRAKVPMWMQLPMLNSPRFYITKDDVSKSGKPSPKKK